MKPNNKRGIIMVTVLMLMPICIILGAIMLSNILSEKHFLRQERDKGQSFYLAETGLNVAYFCYSGSNFSSYTHKKSSAFTDPDVAGTQVTLNALVVPPSVTTRIPFVLASDGWYEYVWNSSKAYASITNTGQPESIRFRVSELYDGTVTGSTRPTAWEIVCVAKLGGITKTHRLSGSLVGLWQNAIFDAGNLNEFIRGADQVISGKVHANGDIYLKPSGTTLTFVTGGIQNSLTTSGNFKYGRDATGRNNMGTVKIGNTYASRFNWPNGLDSYSSNWVTLAPATFGNVVKDRQLGTTPQLIPPTKSYSPDGYYAQQAASGGLNIAVDGGQVKVGVAGAPLAGITTASTKDYIKLKSFYNYDEKRMVDAVEIDVRQLKVSDYPNGLIYSSKPIVLINAQELPGRDTSTPAQIALPTNKAKKTSFVCQNAIYTVGDFNKEQATITDLNIKKGQGGMTLNSTHQSKVSAALMTKNRIYHLSKNYNFSGTNQRNKPATDVEEYTGDDEYVNREGTNNDRDVVEINALLLDGAPLYDESFLNQVVQEDDGEGNMVDVIRPIYSPTSTTTESASWDDYMQNFGQTVVKKRGSIIHLQNGEMAGIDSFSNPSLAIGDELVAWYRDAAYGAPYRDYGYDDLLRTDPPPFAPSAAKKTLWKRY